MWSISQVAVFGAAGGDLSRNGGLLLAQGMATLEACVCTIQYWRSKNMIGGYKSAKDTIEGVYGKAASQNMVF